MVKQKFKLGEKVMLYTFGIFFLLAAIGYIALETYRLNLDGPMYSQNTHFNFSAEGKLGSVIYREANCNSCHRALRTGTSMGLSLDGIGNKRSIAWIETFLTNPKNVYKAKMIDHDDNQEAARDLVKMSKEHKRLVAIFLSELRADAGSSVAKVPPRGGSEFIDSMIGAWAPEEWKSKYKDVRVRLAEEEAEAERLKGNDGGAAGDGINRTDGTSGVMER